MICAAVRLIYWKAKWVSGVEKKNIRFALDKLFLDLPTRRLRDAWTITQTPEHLYGFTLRGKALMNFLIEIFHYVIFLQRLTYWVQRNA
jgi:hypothetical protein